MNHLSLNSTPSYRKFIVHAAVVGLACGASVTSDGTAQAQTPPTSCSELNPLDEGRWELVAHMSDQGGMFDGNGELAPGYSYGAFVADPTAATPDFERAFPVPADEILFITGNEEVWARADYAELRTLIDARGGVFAPNLAFETCAAGDITYASGNVLSRSGTVEDPWISIEGDHFSGIANDRIVWGENDWNGGSHTDLKNDNAGIDVYIRAVADFDEDGVADAYDNCPSTPNPDQSDLDGDSEGDVCDADTDGDGVDNDTDNCVFDSNADQSDYDGDGAGDACDSDVDGDGVIDAEDACVPTEDAAVVDANGCSVAQLCPCAHPDGGSKWKNHGAYVSCVAQAAGDFVRADLISEEEKGELVSAAAESSCGHKK